jgi:TetR/AcrR family transcriptional regulator
MDKITESKEQILSAAAEIFAEKGFEGARVDEIAHRANVNKALIYYYFRSKDELLLSLLREISDDVAVFLETDELASIVPDTTPEAISQVIDKAISVLIRKQNIIRIIVMESVKKSPINQKVFNLLQDILSSMFKRQQSMKAQWCIPEGWQGKAAVMEFFTSIMPIMNYVIYCEHWAEYFKIPEPTLRKQFIEVLIGTHVAYSFKIFGQHT